MTEPSGPRPRVGRARHRAALLVALALAAVLARPLEGGEGWALGPFVRHGSAALSPERSSTFHCPVRNTEVRWEAKDVFNPAAVVRGGRVHLLYRAEDEVGRGGGTSRIGLAVSEDGIHFTRRPTPVFHPDEDFMLPYEWEGGCEDPRVVEREDGTYVMTYTAFDGETARLAVATSRDLVRWTKRGLAFEEAEGGRFEELWSKAGAIVATSGPTGRLIAARIGGKYWMYWGESDIFVATSDNLVDWTPVERQDVLVKKLTHQGAGLYGIRVPKSRTSFKVALAPRRGRFDSALVEPGPPAILRPDGILLLYNASNARDQGDPSLPDGAYAPGQALLDALDPTALVARARESVLRPESALETAGQTPDVCFAESLVFFQGRWLLYYGMGDSRIGVAEYRQAETESSPAP